jgi:hypothetical protein
VSVAVVALDGIARQDASCSQRGAGGSSKVHDLVDSVQQNVSELVGRPLLSDAVVRISASAVGGFDLAISSRPHD